MNKVYSNMSYSVMTKKLVNLKLNTEEFIYDNGKVTISILRPSNLGKKFTNKNYNPNTNIQIWIKSNSNAFKPFMPTHLRVLMNLKLIVMNHPNIKNKLLKAIDDIFYGSDPVNSVAKIKLSKNYIDSLDISAVLLQLFLIEQDIGFVGKSHYDPKSLWLQGWARMFINEDKEIEKLVHDIFGYGGRACPPMVKYTREDDKNHKLYNPNAKPLWYV